MNGWRSNDMWRSSAMHRVPVMSVVWMILRGFLRPLALSQTTSTTYTFIAFNKDLNTKTLLTEITKPDSCSLVPNKS